MLQAIKKNPRPLGIAEETALNRPLDLKTAIKDPIIQKALKLFRHQKRQVFITVGKLYRSEGMYEFVLFIFVSGEFEFKFQNYRTVNGTPFILIALATRIRKVKWDAFVKDLYATSPNVFKDK